MARWVDKLFFKEDAEAAPLCVPCLRLLKEHPASDSSQAEPVSKKLALMRAKDHAIYVEKTKGTSLTAYNVAVADWFRSPEIAQIDLSQWHGGIGETLRMQVQDNVYVERVNVLITDENGELVETGSATPEANGLWWQYITTVDHPGGNGIVVVSASDLPGNEGSLEVSKDVT